MGRATEHNTHSMTSTWPRVDRATWNIYQRIIDYQQLHPVFPGKPLPVFKKTDKVPYLSLLSQHAFILVYAILALVLHQAFTSFTGIYLNTFGVFLVYLMFYITNAVREVRMLRKLMYIYGCLDGDAHERDGIPDTGAGKMVGELVKTAVFRLAVAAMATYSSDVTPLDAGMSGIWWIKLGLQLSVYGLLLDLFFYMYHRACHEVPFLWKYHRTHHLTKHPTALHAAWADDEQELIEILLVPLATFFTLCFVGLRLDFYQWWMCFEYVTYSEIAGHSGLRVYTTTPSPIAPLLRLLNAELALEDHDLHHRKGWKKSFNYGKQTRVWDRLFGTAGERIEGHVDNIEFDNIVHVPLF